MAATIIARMIGSGPRGMASVARILATTDEEEILYPRVLDAIGDALELDTGALWTPAGDVLHCAEAWCAAGFDGAEFVASTRATTLAAGAGLPGRVWVSREP